MSTGENLLHVLNTLESRAVVLEAELKEIDDDIALNASMARKYGDDFFTEGSARLMQMRAEKQQRLAEIQAQLQQTGASVKQGKQLLGSLSDSYGHSVVPSPFLEQETPAQSQHEMLREAGLSPTKILTTSPILQARRG